MKQKTGTEITYEEIMAEVNRLKTEPRTKFYADEEQKKFLLACRGGDKKVTWKAMAGLWNKMPGWRHLTEAGVRYVYNQVFSQN